MKWLVEHPEATLELETKLRTELLAHPEQALIADIDAAEDDFEPAE